MTRTRATFALAVCALGAASCALVWGIDEPHPPSDDAGDAADVCTAVMPDSGDGSPPSCAGGGNGLSNCGPTGQESCCASGGVGGGESFDRGYDKINYMNQSNAAIVSDFTLDKYEVTVGRFRKFVQYVSETGWQPCVGWGKHSHLNDGGGVNGGTEPGWQLGWSTPTDFGGWNSALTMCNGSDTWTADAGANENLPITCVNWFELYAFCIWDGGFLPTDAEWNYAAAAGQDQRTFPWSTSSTDAINCGQANVTLDSGICYGRMLAVGSLEAGAGYWHQLDLAGNALEWVLDGWADGGYWNPDGKTCLDCALLFDVAARTYVGGSQNRIDSEALASWRSYEDPETPYSDYGGRCARPPN
jgi:formylglycine-generating enzyme required for sulfatase activity